MEAIDNPNYDREKLAELIEQLRDSERAIAKAAS